MINWFRRQLGLHVCGPFTPWERKVSERPMTPIEATEVGWTTSQATQYHLIRRYQERHCEKFGKTQQEPLEF